MKNMLAAIGIWLLFFLCFSDDSLWAGPCAMCKNSLASGGSGGLTKGFYWSILLIAGVPVIIISIASTFVYKIWKSEKKVSPSR